LLDEDVDQFRVELADVERGVRVLGDRAGVRQRRRDGGLGVRAGVFGDGNPFDRGARRLQALGFGAFGFEAFGFDSFGLGALGFGLLFGQAGLLADALGLQLPGLDAVELGTLGGQAFGFDTPGFKRNDLRSL